MKLKPFNPFSNINGVWGWNAKTILSNISPGNMVSSDEQMPNISNSIENLFCR